MIKEEITGRQGLSTMIMFILGSSLVVGSVDEAKKDSWLAIAVGAVIALPLVLIYARMKKLKPEMNLFDMVRWTLGKILGKIVIIIFTWFAFHLGALVMRNFLEFINVETLPETPEFVTAIVMGMLVIYAVRSGPETIGRWSSLFVLVVVAVIVFTMLVSIPQYNLSNIMPVMENGIKPIIDGGTSNASFPFAETLIFLMALGTFKPGTSPYKVWLGAVAIGGIILTLASLRNLLLLGGYTYTERYYLSYEALKLSTLGDFFQRFEVIIGANFLLLGLVKICMCLMAASKGTAALFGIKDYKTITSPVGLLMILFSLTVYTGMKEMFDFIVVYKYYALPFEVILPLLIWIIAEIKVKKQKRLEIQTGLPNG